jgi:hypothetical protein
MLDSGAHKRYWIALLLGACALVSGVAAQETTPETDSPVDGCLFAWDKQPFGRHPAYKTLSTSVKVFGIGHETADTEVTPNPALILVNPGVNVGGGTVVQLLNPNGWYCFRTTVNVMGGMTIKAHCKAHLATTSGNVLGSNNGADGKGISVLGSIVVERVGCE